jgi:hypothetical protein
MLAEHEWRNPEKLTHAIGHPHSRSWPISNRDGEIFSEERRYFGYAPKNGLACPSGKGVQICVLRVYRCPVLR